MSGILRLPAAELDLLEVALYLAQQEGLGAADDFLDLIDEKLGPQERSSDESLAGRRSLLRKAPNG